jgi:hypothetical protein
VKLHTLLDLRGNIPTVLFITPGRVHVANLLGQLAVEAGAFYIPDRGYLDFVRLYRLHQAPRFFVTRAKRNFRFRYFDSSPVDRTTGVHSDQTIGLYGLCSKQSYPDMLDAEWLAQLLQHSPARGSFISQAPIRELCEANRIQNLLEAADLKLASVATDILGMPGRAMLAAVFRGETDATALARLAKCRLRSKQEQLIARLLTPYQAEAARLRTTTGVDGRDTSQLQRRLIGRLEALGLWVSVEPLPHAAYWT